MAAFTLGPKTIQSHPVFSGADDAWDQWAFITRSLLESMGGDWRPWLESAKTNEVRIFQADLTGPAALANLNVYLLLSPRTRGKAITMCQLVDDNCGSEVWRNLNMEYQPRGNEPQHAMLEAIVQPKWWTATEHRERVFTDILYD